METEIRTAVKLLDGPEGGNAILGYQGEPPDEIVVFRTRIAAPDVLVCAGTDNKHGLLDGDHIYRKVSRSVLLDRADWKDHPSLMPGCSYVFVRTVHERRKGPR